MTICTKEAFLKSVENHKLTSISADDKETFIRHLRFRGESFNCWFDLITWSNCLCINGDHGCHVFSRVTDMFTFFRSKNNDLAINPDYWAEKVRSESSFGNGVKEFSVETFRNNVKREFRSYCESESNKKNIKPAWNQVRDQLFGYDTECECMDAVFSFKSDYQYLDFNDFWEYDNKEYTYHFIWCLYAIVWGIMQYDKL